MTHYVAFDAPGVRRSRALCGELVDRHRDHDNEPTCPTCAARVVETNATVDAEDVFGAPTPGTQVHSILSDPLAGYRPKGVRP